MKQLYEKNKFRKYSEIEEIKNDIILKARFKNFMNRHKKLLIILACVLILLLVLTFHSEIKSLFLSFFMILLLALSCIYFNTFTIICKNNKMTIKMNMQEIEIDYNNLKNVYIENRKTRIFIKKRDNFSLIILYKAPNGNISTIELPLSFLNKNELSKFLNNFKVKDKKSNNNVVKAQKYQLKRLLIKFTLFILVFIVIIATILV